MKVKVAFIFLFCMMSLFLLLLIPSQDSKIIAFFDNTQTPTKPFLNLDNPSIIELMEEGIAAWNAE